MIVYRDRDQLFLSNEEGNEHVRHLVYDGAEGNPERFYFAKTKTEVITNIYYLIIIKLGLILLNIGTLDQIKQCVWYSHYTNRLDDPIDFILKKSYKNRKKFTIIFLYSDLRITTIISRDGVFSETDEDGIALLKPNFDDKYDGYGEGLIENGTIKLPLAQIYGNGQHLIFSVKNQDDNRTYSITVTKSGLVLNTTYVKYDEIDDHAELVEIVGRNRLYFNKKFLTNTCDVENVLKAHYRPIIILKDNGALEFTTLYTGEIGKVINKIDDVDNFYISINNYNIYIIVKDQLLVSSIRENTHNNKDLRLDDFKVLIDEGASNIKFPTESYYDAMILQSEIRSKRIKSTASMM